MFLLKNHHDLKLIILLLSISRENTSGSSGKASHRGQAVAVINITSDSKLKLYFQPIIRYL